MAKEVERKFLVASPAWRDAVEKVSSLQQFYVASQPDRSVRIRIFDGTAAKLTLKFGGHALTRDEFEYPLDLADAEEMRGFALGNVVAKRRHHVRVGGHLYEIDVFEGPLAGLVVAELETPEHVADNELPHWIGHEITGEAAYYNASLAAHGLPAAASGRGA